MESLESRRLLSSGVLTLTRAFEINNGSVAFVPYGNDVTKTGTLVVKGTAAADSISVIRDGKWIKYTTGDNTTRLIEQSKVKRVLVEGGSGDDRIFIDNELVKPCTVVGGNGDDRIDGNWGATLIGGAGNCRARLPIMQVGR
jgi:hypothetical protein